MKTKMALALLILVSTAFFAAAQTPGPTLDITTSFSFYVGSKLLPAGSYRIHSSGAENQLVTVTSADGKTSAEIGATTRISASSEDKDSAVFDVAGNDHYLSEVYIQGEDGFLLPSATGKHTHMRIKTKK